MIGNTLSHYKIIEKLGQGGMGEVYLAEDSRLDRKVALKILPQHLSERAELRERFEREARAVSSLNHPHICTLHDIGEQDGIHYLVMEHLVGETLEARLAKGPLPLEQTLEYAIQIADALDKAHRQGVVHRDLKPGNIMLVKSGAKLLDFGLAKLQAAETPTNLSALPTEQANLTAEGTILGTLQYMAPEQLEGKEADSRTDIFAFGAVVYEMATGKKAFEGKSQASLIGAILKDDPAPMSELKPMTPALLDQVVKKCLAKDPDERWQSASDLMTGLKWVTEVGTQVDPTTFETSPSPWRRAIPWGIAALGVLMAVIALLLWSSQSTTSSGSAALRRFTMHLTENLATGISAPNFILSPDGGHLVYSASREQGAMIYYRSMDQIESIPFPGTENGRRLFFSPDSQWVGYYDGRSLNRFSIGGGAPVTICDVPNGFSGVAWGADGNIIFGNATSGLSRVSASGGTPESVTTPEGGVGHMWPDILPGGESVLFTIGGDSSQSYSELSIAVLSLQSGEWKTVLQGGSTAQYSQTGHLLFLRSETLMAVPFDLERLAVTGEPVPLVHNVLVGLFGGPHFSFSEDGTLVYLSTAGSAGPITYASTGDSSMVWVDRVGTETLVTQERRNFGPPRISPDGKKAMVIIFDSINQMNMWTYEFASDSFNRISFEGTINASQIWSPDGQWIAFQSNQDDQRNIYRQPIDRSSPPERLTTNLDSVQMPNSWSPDGRAIAFYQENDIFILPTEGDTQPHPFTTSRAYECCAVFSPNGKWLAYVSDEGGTHNVYVRPYPEPDVKWLVSGEEGGGEPVWSPDGRELFYRSRDRMMVVSIETEPSFNAGRPQMLFEGSYVSTTNTIGFQYYDISPDGKRFLMMKQNVQEQPRNQLEIVLNWFSELERLVPTDN